MLIKICGIKNKKIAHWAVEAGADALGFVFAPSSRCITPFKAKEIIKSLPKNILKIGVFVNEDIVKVREVQQFCGITNLQFHGQESAEYCKQFGVPLIKAIKVKVNGEFVPEPINYQKFVKYFLADTYQHKKEGGTGKTFPWQMALPLKEYGPVILAGGLNPENIYQAIDFVQPEGVDVSSGVETHNSKDIQKIKNFIQEIWRWENENNHT